MMGHLENSPDESVGDMKGSSVNKVSINLGGVTLVAIVVFTLVVGMAAWILGQALARDQEAYSEMSREMIQLRKSYDDLKTQNWLLERRLMDKEALDILHGNKLPSDTEFGATGNMQRMKPRSSAPSRP